MKIKKGDLINELSLPAIDGSVFDLQFVQGQKLMISFYRYSSCPFCHLRINETINNKENFGDNYEIICEDVYKLLSTNYLYSKSYCNIFGFLIEKENIFKLLLDSEIINFEKLREYYIITKYYEVMLNYLWLNLRDEHWSSFSED